MQKTQTLVQPIVHDSKTSTLIILDVNSDQIDRCRDIKGNKVVMESKDLKVTTLDAKNTNLSATNSARLKNIDSDDLNVNSDRSIDAESIKGDRVSMESKDLSVSNLDAKNYQALGHPIIQMYETLSPEI